MNYRTKVFNFVFSFGFNESNLVYVLLFAPSSHTLTKASYITLVLDIVPDRFMCLDGRHYGLLVQGKPGGLQGQKATRHAKRVLICAYQQRHIKLDICGRLHSTYSCDS